ncbi:SDR family NAD(P)-dependent oxidoreductase [Arthrobacter sp. H20]|uniref:SDR family NAD(P)-dependent oxidoreductase n=1 Tax=Arthrobacter sp. H20 TaxID=1267981 RepID=UPI000479C912|nr:SDR family NAD(P)-dependent oxidoreductase [Arthrobacter sp. H20]
MTTISGSHFLVIGATGVLGAVVARQLVGAGAQVTLSGRSTDVLDRLAAELGSSVIGTVSADLTHPGAPDEIAQACGDIDGLVYAAGVVAFGPVTELDDETLDELLLVNVLAYIRLIRAVSPQLRRDSTVVQISAVVAESPTAGMAAYSASKAALSAFGKALTLEVRRQGIRVVDVRPPHTETGLVNRAIAGSAPRLPQGKDPEAVAARIVRAIADGEKDLPASEFS